MTTEMDVEIDLSFLAEERTEDPCEHSEHGVRRDVHEGPGIWLVRVQHCTPPTDVLLCDKMVKMMPQVNLKCTGCREGGLRAEDVYTILGRKGVDF